MRQWDTGRLVTGLALCLVGAADLLVLDLVIWPRLVSEGETAHAGAVPRAPRPGHLTNVEPIAAAPIGGAPTKSTSVATAARQRTEARAASKTPLPAPTPNEAAAPMTTATPAASAAEATREQPRAARLAAVVSFGTGKSRLTPSARRRLRRALARLRGGSDRLRVEGHADSRGKELHNRSLGLARARRVVSALRRLGFAASRIDPPVSHGSQRPRATGHSAVAWAKNRRVEVYSVSAPPGAKKRN